MNALEKVKCEHFSSCDVPLAEDASAFNRCDGKWISNCEKGYEDPKTLIG
ncbi:hypothetical protein [Enterobacter hormaechei]|nr:hypothetical protein [Enterobacter hormaechei]